MKSTSARIIGIGLAALASSTGCASKIGPSEPGTYTDSALVVDGLRLHVDEQGEGEHLLVVPAGSAIGPDLEPLLGGVPGLRLVYYDGRGLGRSDPVRRLDQIGFERDVADLEALRQHLGAERLSFLGWSYYAGVVAHYAARYPEHVDRLVLVAPIPIACEPYWRRFQAAAGRRLDKDAAQWVDALRRQGIPASDSARYCESFFDVYLKVYVDDPDVLDDMRGNPCARPNNNPDVNASQFSYKIKRLKDWDWRTDLANVRARTLVIPGLADLINPRSAEIWSESLARAEFHPMDDGSHYPWLDRPEEFFAVVSEFLTAP